jgi:HD-like signal output (HDOD) protein
MDDTILERLRKALERDPNLPALPEHVRKLLRLVADEEVPITVLAREVHKDPAITVKVLRLANSALYGQSREVTSLERAFSVIGVPGRRSSRPPWPAGSSSGSRTRVSSADCCTT